MLSTDTLFCGCHGFESHCDDPSESDGVIKQTCKLQMLCMCNDA